MRRTSYLAASSRGAKADLSETELSIGGSSRHLMGPKPEIFNVLLAVLMSKALKIIKQNPIIDVINIINL